MYNQIRKYFYFQIKTFEQETFTRVNQSHVFVVACFSDSFTACVVYDCICFHILLKTTLFNFKHTNGKKNPFIYKAPKENF